MWGEIHLNLATWTDGYLFCIFHYTFSPSLFLYWVESEFRYARWKKAVQKSMNWETTEPISNGNGIAPSVTGDISY